MSTSVRWPVPAALAIAPLVLGILVSFSADHSAGYGLLVVAIVGACTAIAAGVSIVFLPGGAQRIGAIVKLVVAVLGGGYAVVLAYGVAIAPQYGEPLSLPGQVAELQWLAAGLLVLLGATDLLVGLAVRRADRFGRDWITLGALEILAAIVLAVVPSGYDYHYEVTDTKGLPPVQLELDAAVIVVGLLGAALAVIGVYLAISAVSLMSGRQREQVAA